ncbi:MAG: SRPBCC family protein [Planctomycetaceae bacterium]
MSNSNKPKVVVERTYRTQVQELWELWTTKEGFESWWGPVGFRAKVHKLEARVGGTLYYDMIADTPEMIEAMKQMGRPASHETNSTFSQYQPFDRLELTNVIDFLPEVPAYDNKILVEFFPQGDSVRMVVTLDPLHSDEFTNMQKEGFTSQISKLDKRYGSGAT